MNELGDILRHHGVKGMKWGVRKDRGSFLKRALKNRKQQYDSKMVKIADSYHSKHKGKRVYKKQYNRNLKLARGNHHKAVIRTRKDVIAAKRTIALNATAAAAPFAIHAGAKLVRTAHKVATNPANIRRGKNIIQAMKRSPILYVDGKTFTDAFDML